MDPTDPILYHVWMVKIYCYACVVWEYVIDSLGVSEVSTYGSWWLEIFSLAGASFCFAVGVYLGTPYGASVAGARWSVDMDGYTRSVERRYL